MTRLTKRLAVPGFCVLLACGAGGAERAASAAPRSPGATAPYTVQSMGALRFTDSVGTPFLNNAGQAGGFEIEGPPTSTHRNAVTGPVAAYWDPVAGVVTLPPVGNVVLREVHGINDLGQLIGDTGTLEAAPAQSPSTNLVAFFWDPTSGGTLFPNVNGPSIPGSGLSLNDVGELLFYFPTLRTPQAWLRSPQGQFAQVGTGLPVCVNGPGQVLMDSPGATSSLFTPSQPYGLTGNTTSLGLPPGADVFEALKVNDAGVVCGIGQEEGGILPWMWDRTHGFTELANEDEDPEPVGVNDAGQFVGVENSAQTAVFWPDPNHEVDLNTLVPPGSPKLYAGIAINDRGQIEAVSGTFGRFQMYLLSPSPAVQIRTLSSVLTTASQVAPSQSFAVHLLKPFMQQAAQRADAGDLGGAAATLRNVLALNRALGPVGLPKWAFISFSVGVNGILQQMAS